MTQKFGPWKVSPGWVRDEESNKGIVQVHQSNEASVAIAHLIAAAPTMLAALHAVAKDSPFVSDESSCECGEFAEFGTCSEVVVQRAIALAEAAPKDRQDG